MLTLKEFNDTYWFSPIQMVTVRNPKSEDFPFMVEMRNFVIKAGATEKMPGHVANNYLRKMTKILAQDQNKMEFLSDPNLMKQYFDGLIVRVDDMMPQMEEVPEYMRDIPKTMLGEAPAAAPAWQNKVDKAEQPVINEDLSKPPVEAPAAPKEEVKEFAVGDINYKMTIDKNGATMFFKDGRRIAEVEYAKAASML